MPPNPSPPGQRRRRNLDQPEWKTLPTAKIKTPPMPGGSRAPAAAKAYWKALWASPVAAMFLEIDKFPLARAARLHALVIAGDATASEQAELRAIEMAHGVSPLARRKLQWEVEQAAGPGAAQAKQPVDDELAKRRDRRRRVACGE